MIREHGVILMSERNTDRGWIPLMDYAMKKGVSLSTLRRYIKANKIDFKVENGRYLLFDGEIEPPRVFEPRESVSVQAKLQKLERDLQKAQEEIAELKMLVAIYEEKIARQRLDS